MKIKELLQEIKVSLLAMVALLVILCGLYPLVVWGIAQVVFPSRANGSLVEHHGKIVGSSLMAQSFTGDKYFHPRPSAAGDTGFDGTSSGGSNLGPLSQKLVDQVKERMEQYRKENNLPSSMLVPADAVTTSGSGLDPHISLSNAGLQAGRVARVRNMSLPQVNSLIQQCTQGPNWGLLGEPGVNVLRLNLALEALPAK